MNQATSNLRRAALALAAAAITLLSAPSCGDGGCPDAVCVCRDQSACAPTCNEAGCDLSCQSVSSCDGVCGAACSFECRDASTCRVDCGDDCHATCASVSSCDVICGEGCIASCSDASSCRARMRSGTLSCARVSTCQAVCIAADGNESPATVCPDGTQACGPCP